MATATDPEANGTADARAKPPFLRRVRIRGYKSIAFCDVTLEPLTILVGRNASGKSNFLDALAFIESLLSLDVFDAVKRHGGFSSIICKSPTTSEIEFTVEAEIPHVTPTLTTTRRVSYRLALNCADHEDVQIVDEELVSLDGIEPASLAPSRSDLYRVLLRAFNGDAQHTREYMNSMYPTDVALIGSKRSGWVGSAFQKHMKAIGVYNFFPSTMRQPQIHTPGGLLERSGRNLPDVLRRLDQAEPVLFRRLCDYLSAIIEQVVAVRPVTIGGYDTLRFQMNAAPGQAPVDFDAASMSDGTLRILASLTAAFQVAPGGGPPSLIAIEEPETSLHPAAMRALVDALDEATLRTQILLTTHSAEMLDNPTIKPENIRVVQMIDGQTVIAPVDAASIEIVRRNLNTLGGLERDNLLEPDLDDVDRQQRLKQGVLESPK